MKRDINLPPVTRDEYNHLMRLLGEPGDVGPRSLGVGLNGAGVIELRRRFSSEAIKSGDSDSL